MPTKTKKILFITARADLGGGPKHVFDLLRKIQEDSSFEVYVASPDQGEFSKEYQQRAAGFYPIPFRGLSLSRLLGLFLFCRKNQIHVLHSHGRGAGYYSRFLKILGILLGFHFFVFHSFHGALNTQSALGRIKNFVDRCLRILTDCFISVSEDEKKMAIEHKLAQENKVRVIYNGVDVQQIKSRGFEFLRKKDNDNDKIRNKIVVGYIARLDRQKGLDILIPTFQRFLLKHPDLDIEFLIAGDGDEKTNLVKLIQTDRIKLIGPTLDPISFLYKLDLYLSFSRGEGFPISVVEAIAVGCPLLLSDVTGHREFGAQLFCLNDESDFEKKFLQATRNLSLFSVPFDKKFSLDTMVESIKNFYNQKAEKYF